VPLLLTAVAVGLWFGVAPQEIAHVLAHFPPLPGRLRPLAGRHNALLLDDTVNASPAATLAALDVLALFDRHPRIAVLGDMWDLGHRELDAHRQVGQAAAGPVDWLVVKGERAQEIATGALAAGLDPGRVFRAYTDADVLRFLDGLLSSERLQQSAETPSVSRPVILVKGDRQARMERIVAGLLAEPDQAKDLLVRQSPGWQQVRPLVQDRPTWVEIDLDAIAGNVAAARALVGPQVRLCAVLKADGYGHGAVGIARTALNNGVHMLAVACLAEAITLRRAAIDAPVLVLGYTPAWQARDTLRHNVTATVYDLDVARALSQASADLNRPARVHVKVDTGMGRLGLLPDEVVPFVQQLQSLPGLLVEGIFTHFSVADSILPQHLAHTRTQLAVFEAVLANLAAAGICPPLIHAANSSAMLTQPASRFNMVRLGIALYGLAPSAAVPLPPGFRPALSWKTQVAQVKTLPPGAVVSYGNTYRTSGRTVVAVIPVGYADGFRRAPRHWGHVLVRGQIAPIIGRVTMDQTMLDVTAIPGVRQGDEVVLIGRQGEAEITVEQVAEQLGTINYEVISEILARVPRVV
jgi:alanine racemase